MLLLVLTTLASHLEPHPINSVTLPVIQMKCHSIRYHLISTTLVYHSSIWNVNMKQILFNFLSTFHLSITINRLQMGDAMWKIPMHDEILLLNPKPKYSKSPSTAIRNFIPSIFLPLAPLNFLNNKANVSISPETMWTVNYKATFSPDIGQNLFLLC